MRVLRALWIRLTGLFTGGRRSQQFDAELASHLEMHVEDNIGRGLTPEEARRQALIALGGSQSVRDAYRDRGGLPALESLWQDVLPSSSALRHCCWPRRRQRRPICQPDVP